MVYRDSVYQVPRQKVQVEVEKLDAEKETALAGAVFGLYTAETITDWRGRELERRAPCLERLKRQRIRGARCKRQCSGWIYRWEVTMWKSCRHRRGI